jgi:DNA polymerase-3 subunit gamma/tau
LSYQVIARKWRPQSFLGLVGQDHVSTTLLNALRNNRLPQALLFTGVRGTGKTSTARILAKSLRCQKAQDFTPCDVCPDCLDIANSRSLDVIEIDGASNNGVDAIRDLRETVGYMPSSGRYKIYIIDEVHMLSTSAFNALLKTLEEPPTHVVFILATTEAQKIPNTILSRCQRFDFRRISSRQIASHLEKICQAEGFIAEAEALWLVARQADGSMRDGQSLLDQVITFCNGEISLAKVIDVLGLTDRTVLLEVLESLAQRNNQKAIDCIEKIFLAGYDPKVFAQDLLEEIRHSLLVRLCPENPTRFVDLPDTEIDQLKQISSDLSDEDLHLLFDMALKGVNDLMRSQDARIVLEMLILRMTAAPRIASFAMLTSASSAATRAPGAPSTVQNSVYSSVPNAAQNTAQRSAGSLSAGASPRPSAPSVASTSSATATPAPAATAAPASISPAPASASTLASSSSGQPAAATYTVQSFTRPATGYPNAKPAPFVAEIPVEANSTVTKAESTTTTTSTATKSALSSAGTPSSSTHNDNQSETAAEPLDPQRANDPWYKFVDQVKKANGLLGAMLENTHLLNDININANINTNINATTSDAMTSNAMSSNAGGDNRLIIGLPRKMSFMLDKIKEPENIKRIETFLETFWNKKYSVQVKLADGSDLKTSKATPKSLTEQSKEARKKTIEQAIDQNPLVQSAKNVFKTQFKSIKDVTTPKAPNTSKKEDT